MEEATNLVEKLGGDSRPCPKEEAEEEDIPKAVIVEEAEEDKSELLKTREVSEFTANCLDSLKIARPKNFKETIALAIKLNREAGPNNMTDWVAGTYDIKKWNSDVGLYSHPMCESLDSKLATRDSKDKASRIELVGSSINDIPKHFNKIRGLYLKAVKDKEPKEVIENYRNLIDDFYSSLLGTLANHESLTTADDPLSLSRAKDKNDPFKNYVKAPGVKFYKDLSQTNPESQKNIGLFQLPLGGNINSCIKGWNDKMGSKSKSCKITKKGQDDMLLLNGASDQFFNAFCGTSKLVQSFGVQVNANKFDVGKVVRRTHKENYDSKKGKLKESKDRCVTLFTHTNNTYNHFGTLGFTREDNTKRIVDGVIKLEGIE